MIQPRTVLVTGSHTEGQRIDVMSVLDDVYRKELFDRLVAGGADYVDTFAMDWAISNKIPFVTEYALWRYGNAAGPIRNQRMLGLYKPYLVLAFPGKSSVGTRNMMAEARAANITVREFPL